MDLFNSTNKKIDLSLTNDWKNLLNSEFESEYFKSLIQLLSNEIDDGAILYPPINEIFSAYNYTTFENTKVVIIGQDPYHSKNQANGLCFSVTKGIPQPPSLVNIFKELKNDLNIHIPDHGDLSKWAQQGVLLLNASLTVRANQPNSHKGIGWEKFTDATIRVISEKKEGIIFLLWGKNAQSKIELIDINKHYILESSHPSPYSANYGFLGCKHFSKTNEILKSIGRKPIDWDLNN